MTWNKVDHNFVKDILRNIQSELFLAAFKKLFDSVVYCQTNDEILETLKSKKFVIIAWDDIHDDGAYEKNLKELCKESDINSTKILCVLGERDVSVLKHMDIIPENICQDNKKFALFGRSY